MSAQLPLDLRTDGSFRAEDFVESTENADVRLALDGWARWPQRKLLMSGPAASGKSHMARIWATRTGARVIPGQALIDASIAAGPTPAAASGNLVVDGIEGIAGHGAAEEALLHLHNLTLAEGHSLLLTGRGVPAQWPIRLPDLGSRIAATQIVRFAPPDTDLLRQALLVKHFANRGLNPPHSLIHWLARRVERDYPALRDVVETLDRATLTTGRPLGTKLAREILNLDTGPSHG